jgi:putative ABC transport system permease protein
VLLVNLSPSRGGTLEDVEEVLGRLARVPGVISVAASGTDGLYTTLCTEVDGRAGRETPVSLWAVSPGYFATMKIPLHQGREFDGTDTRTTDDVVVVNDVLARSLFGRIDPVGRRLPLVGCQPGDPAAPSGPLTIVGVADDTHGAPAIYLPYAQLSPEGPMWTAGLSAVTLAARGTGHAALLARPVRHALREAAPTATVGAVQTEANLLERRLKAVRLLTALYVLLGLLATGQAAFGLYGTVSQFVSRRTAEIGVRVVFGAGTLDVVRLVVRQALTPVVAGLLLGLAASPLVARVMWAARLTGEAGWGELLAIAAGIALVMVAAFAAASVPVWRVSRMDPAAALREE